jgi:predicted AlkP superfamily phosphohydrolase/phosphomutase
MKNSINFKTIGFIALTESLTKNGKKIYSSVSTKVYKTSKGAKNIIAKKTIQDNTKAVKQALNIIEHALNIKSLKQSLESLKNKCNSFVNRIKYGFQLVVAKAKYFLYISSLNKSTKQFVFEFIDSSKSYL